MRWGAKDAQQNSLKVAGRGITWKLSGKQRQQICETHLYWRRDDRTIKDLKAQSWG